MPLLAGKKNIGHNIKVEEEAGKPRKQAVAIALSKARGKDDRSLGSLQRDLAEEESILREVRKPGHSQYGGNTREIEEKIKDLKYEIKRTQSRDSLPLPVKVTDSPRTDEDAYFKRRKEIEAELNKKRPNDDTNKLRAHEQAIREAGKKVEPYRTANDGSGWAEEGTKRFFKGEAVRNTVGETGVVVEQNGTTVIVQPSRHTGSPENWHASKTFLLNLKKAKDAMNKEPWTNCPQCSGVGERTTGNKCTMCNGQGKVIIKKVTGAKDYWNSSVWEGYKPGMRVRNIKTGEKGKVQYAPDFNVCPVNPDSNPGGGAYWKLTEMEPTGSATLAAYKAHYAKRGHIKDAREATPEELLNHAQKHEVAQDHTRAMDSYRQAAAGFRKIGDQRNEQIARDGIAECQRQAVRSFHGQYEHPSVGKVQAFDAAPDALRSAVERTRAGEVVRVAHDEATGEEVVEPAKDAEWKPSVWKPGTKTVILKKGSKEDKEAKRLERNHVAQESRRTKSAKDAEWKPSVWKPGTKTVILKKGSKEDKEAKRLEHNHVAQESRRTKSAKDVASDGTCDMCGAKIPKNRKGVWADYCASCTKDQKENMRQSSHDAQESRRTKSAKDIANEWVVEWEVGYAEPEKRFTSKSEALAFADNLKRKKRDGEGDAIKNVTVKHNGTVAKDALPLPVKVTK